MQVQKQNASTYKEYEAFPDKYATIEGVPPALAVRLPGFVDFGINGDKLVKVIRQAGPEKGPATPGWAEAIMEYGHQAIKKGEEAEKKAHDRQAEHNFLEASFWYFLARFPHILNEGGAKAYQLHTAAYLRAVKNSPSPLETIEITLDGKGGNAFLRLPHHGSSRFPAVMIAGGIDVWKSDLEIHSLSEEFLKKGIATLLIDVPGTGEAPFPASSIADRWFLAALETLKKHPKINGRALGFYGLSFGGYWATKLAFVAPWLAGTVNTGGPIHYTFQPECLEALPLGIKFALAQMLNLNPLTDDNHTIEELGQFSLEIQGLLSNTTQAPLLYINGENDELVPIQEISFLKEKNVKLDTLIFAQDRHVASRNWRLHEQFAVQWFAEKLKTYK